MIKQIVNSDIIPSNNYITSNILDINFPSNYEGDRMQQLVALGTFVAGHCYYIRLEIPQDSNYDLNYGIRLMHIDNISVSSTINLQDNNNSYQFVKYISIPKYSTSDNDTSTIWHYKKDNIINAAVALPTLAYDTNNLNNNEHKIFYDNTNFYIGNNTTATVPISSIEKNIYTVANNFQSINDIPITREFLIYPEIDCNLIYFYLKPISEDNNIIWQKNTQSYIGRYVNIQNVHLSYAEVAMVPGFDSTWNINNIAIWGRSEQLIALNGQELKIGPSGYYELKNFDIDSLYIANVVDNDKYTIDIQYS